RPFTPAPLESLSLLSMEFFERIAGIFIGSYGLATMLRGYLIYRSGYLPRTLGVLFGIGGAAFVVQNLAVVLAPAYASGLLPVLMAPAGLAMMLWLILRGVNVEKWQRAVARSGALQT